MDRQDRVEELNKAIEQAQKELEFLNDSGTFYDLDLGEGRKTVLIPDFSSSTGIKQTFADNCEKLSSAWYHNYAGFSSAQEELAQATFSKLASYLKLQRIHEWLYPTGLDLNATGDDIFKWVITYDVASDSFIPKNLGGNGGTEAPTSYENLFYFKGTPALSDTESADTLSAINLMRDSINGTDTPLRVLFSDII